MKPSCSSVLVLGLAGWFAVSCVVLPGCGGAQSGPGAANEQLEEQVIANLAQMSGLTFKAACPAIDPTTETVQCQATAPGGEQVLVDLEKRADGFHISKVNAVFEETLGKAAALALKQFGLEAGEVKCPDLAINGTAPRCTAIVEEVELAVIIDLGDAIGARVESGLIDASAIERHIVETTALPGGVTSAACGKKYYVAKPGAVFQCEAKGPQETMNVHVRIDDASGRVTVSMSPFEDE